MKAKTKTKAETRSRTAASSIDSYLAALPDDQRKALETLRKVIRAAAPRAEECISYQMPAFRLDGKALVAFSASAKHCAFYPLSGTTLRDHQELLQGYDTSKGTLRFQATRPLPATLVRKLVKARIAENAASRPAAVTRATSRERSGAAGAAPPARRRGGGRTASPANRTARKPQPKL